MKKRLFLVLLIILAMLPCSFSISEYFNLNILGLTYPKIKEIANISSIVLAAAFFIIFFYFIKNNDSDKYVISIMSIIYVVGVLGWLHVIGSILNYDKDIIMEFVASMAVSLVSMILLAILALSVIWPKDGKISIF
ncbi:MAG: hypothetical protein KGI58_00890 [Patescibacteria group bacterium]|nr:hypothetical protein [Patescibacteria group bacterium]